MNLIKRLVYPKIKPILNNREFVWEVGKGLTLHTTKKQIKWMGKTHRPSDVYRFWLCDEACSPNKPRNLRFVERRRNYIGVQTYVTRVLVVMVCSVCVEEGVLPYVVYENTHGLFSGETPNIVCENCWDTHVKNRRLSGFREYAPTNVPDIFMPAITNPVTGSIGCRLSNASYAGY